MAPLLQPCSGWQPRSVQSSTRRASLLPPSVSPAVFYHTPPIILGQVFHRPLRLFELERAALPCRLASHYDASILCHRQVRVRLAGWHERSCSTAVMVQNYRRWSQVVGTSFLSYPPGIMARRQECCQNAWRHRGRGASIFQQADTLTPALRTLYTISPKWLNPAETPPRPH